MSAPTAWLGWLGGLAANLWAAPAAPGTHVALLEEARAGAQLTKALSKPAGERDEELVHRLRVDYRRREKENIQATIESFARRAFYCEQPSSRECCAAAGWVRQRVAASYRAVLGYYYQQLQQATEELAAAEGRRPPALVAPHTLQLDLPEALQQHPPRLDMCRSCAAWLEKVELHEEANRVHAQHSQKQLQMRGLQPAFLIGAASPGSAAPAAAGAAPHASSAHQSQQQQSQQQHQRHSGDGGGDGGGKEDAPATPTQQQQQQQQQLQLLHHHQPQQQQQQLLQQLQQHACTEQDRKQQREQEQQHACLQQELPQQQDWRAAGERNLLLPGRQQQQQPLQRQLLASPAAAKQHATAQPC